jgi:hypothetical protein
MRYVPLAIVAALVLPFIAACAPTGFSGPSNAAVPEFNEPTFTSVQPVAYPHPTGCEICGFTDKLGTPQQ